MLAQVKEQVLMAQHVNTGFPWGIDPTPEVAIKLLRENEPQGGYYGCFSERSCQEIILFYDFIQPVWIEPGIILWFI